MEDFKNRLYNYETPPPEASWSKIVTELNNEKVIKLPGLRRRSKFIFYGLTAAASLIIIFISTFLANKNKETKSVVESSVVNANNIESQNAKDSIAINQEILEKIIQNPQDKKLIASNTEGPKKYITIAGPEGQPVKISPKAATLILSADKEYPPKPVWNKKIEKWKKLMLSSTTSPTATTLVDILQMSAGSDHVE